MESLSKRVEKIVKLSDWLRKHLDEIERLESVTSYMKEHLICDPYNEWCPWHYVPEYIKIIRKWLGFLDELYEHDITEALNYWDIKYHFDIEKSEIIDICLKDSLSECIYVHLKVPIENKEEVKNMIIDVVKERIRKAVESLPENFIRDVLALAAFIETVERRVRELEEKYKELLRETEKALGKVIK